MNEPMVETGDPPLSKEDANWAMVRSALAAMSEKQDEFLREMREARRVDALFLVERFDGLDLRVDQLKKAVGMQNDLMDVLNTIVAGVRSASNSTYDMATTAARKIERVRKFLRVPDEVANEPEAPAAGGNAAGASDRPPRPVR